MSVFSASMTHRSFWWQISALCFVLGLLLAAAAFTATQIHYTGVGPINPALSYGTSFQVEAQKAASSESEIKKLREYTTELENKLSQGSKATSTINKELQDMKLSAGLTDVTGPGVQIVLDDAPRQSAMPGDPIRLGNLIHDADIANVVNELKACGAEAIAVNGQRIVGATAIRCVGPVVHVNFVPSAPPYVIQAIGDPDTLVSGMNLQDSVLDELRRVSPSMVRVEKKTKLLLPGFAGGTLMRYVKLVKGTAEKDSESDAGSGGGAN
jgi:uncharacterized protein YlxW (UPF0749 family)